MPSFFAKHSSQQTRFSIAGTFPHFAQSPISLSCLLLRLSCHAPFLSTEQGRQYLVCVIFRSRHPQTSQLTNFRFFHRLFAFHFLSASPCCSRCRSQSLLPWTAGTLPHLTQTPLSLRSRYRAFAFSGTRTLVLFVLQGSQNRVQVILPAKSTPHTSHPFSPAQRTILTVSPFLPCLIPDSTDL